MSETTCTIRGSLIKESEKAFLFKVVEISGKILPPDLIQTSWFPKSQVIRWMTDPKAEDKESDILVLKSDWILKQKELI